MFYTIYTHTIDMKRIALFASGSGTNAEQIMQYFHGNPHIKVDRVYTNNSHAGVITRAAAQNVSLKCFSRQALYHTSEVLHDLQARQIDLIVLAGFLWLMPSSVVQEFSVINIHPSLLPKYGGKGMYGMRVHEAVIQNGEKESGITIHKVDEAYDSGSVLLQQKLEVLPTDNPESLQQRIHALEYEYYPKVIEQLLNG